MEEEDCLWTGLAVLLLAAAGAEEEDECFCHGLAELLLLLAASALDELDDELLW